MTHSVQVRFSGGRRARGGSWYDTGSTPSAEATIGKGFLVLRVTDVGPPDRICEYQVVVEFKTDPGVGWVWVLGARRILSIVAEVRVRVGLDACVEGEVEGSGEAHATKRTGGVLV